MPDMALPQLTWRVVFNRATPPDHAGWGRVRAAQIRELGRAMDLALWGQLFNAVFLVYLLLDTVPTANMALWLALLTLMLAYTLYARRKVGNRAVAALPRRAVDLVAYQAVCFGVIWAFPGRLFFPYATHPQQLAICLITAVMMAGAAFIFAPVPAAAAAYVLVMGVATTHMLSTTDSPLIAALAPIYTGAMLMIALVNGRAFMARTCLHLALEERRETVSLLLREYESSDADWLWQVNSQLLFQDVSPRFARALGRDTEALSQLSVLDLLREAPRADQASRRALAETRALLEQRQPISDVVVPVEIDGTVRSVELSARPRFSRRGRFLGYQGVGSDVTEKRQAAARIAHMARHDALTGLPNRLQLLDSLAEALAGAQASGTSCALLLVDLDRFKAINDTLGHAAGDHLLQQVARAFEMVIGDDMTAGRLGGDEFAIVVPQVESRHALEQMCLALIGTLHGPFHYREQRLSAGASIGVALAPDDARSVEELMRHADLAMYRAKEESGDGVRFYEPALHLRAEERRRTELALQGALDAGEFSLVFQPVVHAGTGRIQACEALLRWTSRELGPVSPATFIPIAEETGLLGRIGAWVLRTACLEAANWPSDVALAVNVSPRQLQEPGFIVTLMSALTHAGLSPSRLELEVTETVFLELARTRKALEQIQSLGVRLAMDDFGTGYSSLGYLRQAQFDTLKIDQSFIQGLRPDDDESAAIIRAVVALAGSMGMDTVAEGVATEEQLALVRALGCEKIQGYVFSHPVPGSAIRALLAGQSAERAPRGAHSGHAVVIGQPIQRQG